MGVIWDIVKDIPTAAVLKERILDFEAKLAASETQVSLIEIELRKANTKIDQLTDENNRLTEQISAAGKSDESLDPIAHNIIAEFARHHGGSSVPNNIILQSVAGDATALSYHFHELRENGYIEAASFNVRSGPESRLTQKGKKYWMENSN